MFNVHVTCGVCAWWVLSHLALNLDGLHLLERLMELHQVDALDPSEQCVHRHLPILQMWILRAQLLAL